MKRAIIHAALAATLVFAFSGVAEAKTHHLSKATIMHVQARLQQLGYQPGDVDGHFGKKTHQAVAQFQATLRMNPTGELNKKTLALLTAPSTAYAPQAPVTYAQQYTAPTQTYAAPIAYAKPTWQQPYQYRMYQGDYMVQGSMQYIRGQH